MFQPHQRLGHGCRAARLLVLRRKPAGRGACKRRADRLNRLCQLARERCQSLIGTSAIADRNLELCGALGHRAGAKRGCGAFQRMGRAFGRAEIAGGKRVADLLGGALLLFGEAQQKRLIALAVAASALQRRARIDAFDVERSRVRRPLRFGLSR